MKPRSQSKSRGLLATVVVALVAALVLLVSDRMPPPTHAPGSPAPTGSVARERARSSVGDAETTDPVARAEASDHRQDGSTARDLAGPAGRTLTLLARCITATGAPIVDAQLVAAEVVGRPAANTDGAGHAELVLAWPAELVRGNHHFVVAEVSGPGRTRRWIQERVADGDGDLRISLGDIVLGPGGDATGLVLDARGAPVADAQVFAVGPATPAESPREEQRRVLGRGFDSLASVAPWAGFAPATHTDAAGRYLLRGLPAARVSIVARHRDWLCGYTEPVQISAGAETAVPALTLMPIPDENVIRGIVVDANGLAVAGSRIDVFADGAPRNVDPETTTSSTAPDGAFAARVLADRSYTIVARRPHPARGRRIVEGIDAGTRGVVVRFAQSKRIPLAVTSRDGTPVSDARISGQDAGGFGIRIDTEPAEGGGLELLAPSEPFELAVWANGYRPGRAGPFDPAALPDRIEVVLEPAGAVSGRVVFEGRGVAGAVVHLHRVSGDGARLHEFAHGIYTRLEAALFTRARTDAEGRFALDILQDGDYVLHAELDGRGRAESPAIALHADAGVTDIQLELHRPGCIVGRVLTGPAGDAAGQHVAATRGDGHARVSVADREGHFRFEGLAPGGWQVRACSGDDRLWLTEPRTRQARGVEDLPVDVEVRPGETVSFDLDLRAMTSAQVRGQLALDGVPCGNFRVSLWVEGRYVFATTAADGSFSTAGVPGDTRLHFFGTLPQGGRLEVRRRVSLREGLNSIDVRSPTGGVAITGASSANATGDGQGPTHALVWPERDGTRFVYRFDPDPAGEMAIAFLPVGAVELRRRPGAATDVERWSAIATGQIEAGGTAELTVR